MTVLAVLTGSAAPCPPFACPTKYSTMREAAVAGHDSFGGFGGHGGFLQPPLSSTPSSVILI